MEGQQRRSRSVLYNLRCDERVRNQTPKEGRNSASMDGCEDGEDYRTLLEDGASR